MTVLFSNKETKKISTTSEHLEPTRGSIFLLLCRIFLVMVGTDILYLSIRIFVFEFNPQWISGRTIDIGFFFFLLCSYVVQIFLIYSVLLHWLNRRYYLESHNLIEKKGIFITTERTYDLRNLKSVIVTQGFFGKLFNFGTIALDITAPGLSDEVSLTEIPHPHKLESQIRKFI